MQFQREGVQFGLQHGGRCMIADEMGLGKTLQGISIALAYKNMWPLLVVAPASMKLPWADELERWIPSLKPGDVRVIRARKDVGTVGAGPITVVPYSMFYKSVHWLQQ